MDFSKPRFRPIPLFVTATLALALVHVLSAQAQTYSVIYNFTGQSDGGNPVAGLSMDSDGNLYGAAFAYGAHGFGNVYQLAHSGSGWTFSALYGFRGPYESDGAEPESRPVFGPDGSLYGTTHLGGFGQGCIAWYNGCGTVYSLGNNSGTWVEDPLFQFGSANGGYPSYGDVVVDSSGNLYDSSPASGNYYNGVVYELTRADRWSESILYSFQGAPDGTAPLDGPLLARGGNLYGTASAGGVNGYGAVYELSPSAGGWTETVLYSFTNGNDGGAPASNLVVDRAGDLYGATQTGGTYGGGTVFQLIPSPAGTWRLNTIYQFRSSALAAPVGTQSGGCAIQGLGSNRTLTIDSAGNLYGTTSGDVLNPWGSVFKLHPVASIDWSYTPLHSFTGTTDGGVPWGSVILDGSGNLYGTAALGGANSCGVVFEVTME